MVRTAKTERRFVAKLQTDLQKSYGSGWQQKDTGETRDRGYKEEVDGTNIDKCVGNIKAAQRESERPLKSPPGSGNRFSTSAQEVTDSPRARCSEATAQAAAVAVGGGLRTSAHSCSAILPATCPLPSSHAVLINIGSYGCQLTSRTVDPLVRRDSLRVVRSS